MKLLYWLALRGTFAALLYFGLYGGVAGAANVMVFLVWVSLVLGICAFLWAPLTPAPPLGRVLAAANVVLDSVFTVAMVWAGMPVTAVAFVIGQALVYVKYASMVQKGRTA